MNWLLFVICVVPTFLGAFEASTAKVKVLYSSLRPFSLHEHLAFHFLYPQTPEGQRALYDGWSLISSKQNPSYPSITSLNEVAAALVALVNKETDVKWPHLSDRDFQAIEQLTHALPNRKLKGFRAKNEAEILTLDSEDIDLARALFLSQFDGEPEKEEQLRSYEAMIDLIAMQIRARCPQKASAEMKIRAINAFIFTEMGYRFPPQSLYAKEIDYYTFLPSVLDSRRGVCLGISMLYLTLAQRLELPLEIVTPPGHIFVRHRKENEFINIETTARGVDIDSDEYLSIDTFALEQRSLKEVVGMVYFNQASTFLQKQQFQRALSAYRKAALYIEGDSQLDQLTGLCCLFLGLQEEGEELLKRSLTCSSFGRIPSQRLVEDYFSGAVDSDGLQVLFLPVDETRKSIQQKQEKLFEVVKRCPKFRDGMFALATTFIQLHRLAEAVKWLERYHAIDPDDPKVEYYLAALYIQRYDYPHAWSHFRHAEALVNMHCKTPKCLKELYLELTTISP